MTISNSYFTVNGNGTQKARGCGGAPGSSVSAAPPNASDCGIKMTPSGIYFSVSGLSNFTMRYMEILGDSTPANNVDILVFSPYNATISTWDHIYGHNAGCVYFAYNGDHRTVSNSYWWGTEVQGPLSDGCHGQYDQENVGTSNGTEHNNVYRDIAGTAIWSFLAGGGTHTN